MIRKIYCSNSFYGRIEIVERGKDCNCILEPLGNTYYYRWEKGS